MSVSLHTDLGDIKIELFCEQCPKTCEVVLRPDLHDRLISGVIVLQNFLALCASGYYDNCIFHRNIKGFMVQTGDPTNTGKKGESIWGGKFEDELHDNLTHSARGIVSMANNGPNTNGSQFFITYDRHPHLDLKYTVFGK